MLRMLCGLTRPSRGTVRVLGGDPRRERALARRIGLVPQQESVFERMTAFEFVRVAAVLQGLPDPADAARRALGRGRARPRRRRATLAPTPRACASGSRWPRPSSTTPT